MANNKAIQHSVNALNGVVHAAKARMSVEVHGNVEKRLAERRPVTVVNLQREVETLFTRVMQEVEQKAGTVDTLGVFDFPSELDQHKDQLTDEMNRRYMIEMRQILNEVTYAAREELGRQVMYRLDGTMLEEEIKTAIDSAVAYVKGVMADKLAGWTLLISDLEAKYMELEKLGKEVSRCVVLLVCTRSLFVVLSCTCVQMDVKVCR